MFGDFLPAPLTDRRDQLHVERIDHAGFTGAIAKPSLRLFEQVVQEGIEDPPLEPLGHIVGFQEQSENKPTFANVGNRPAFAQPCKQHRAGLVAKRHSIPMIVKEEIGQRFQIELHPAIVAIAHHAVGMKDLGRTSPIDLAFPIKGMNEGFESAIVDRRHLGQLAKQPREVIRRTVDFQDRLHCHTPELSR